MIQNEYMEAGITPFNENLMKGEEFKRIPPRYKLSSRGERLLSTSSRSRIALHNRCNNTCNRLGYYWLSQ